MKKITLIFILLFINCNKTEKTMYIDVKDFLNNQKNDSNSDFLLISCKENQIVPPISVLKENKSLIKDFDFSNVNMENYKSVKDISFTNHFVKSLPNNLYVITDLEYLILSYSINVELEKELEKLSKLRNLKELDISLSLIEDKDYLLIEKALPKTKIIR